MTMTKTRRLIHRILDSPALSTGLLVTMYLATAATGVFGLLWPHSLATNLALFAWPAAGGSWLAIAGGLAAAVSIPDGWWWLERGAVVLLIGAITIRVYVLLYQLTAGETTLAEAAISVAFLAAILLGLCLRLLHIRGLALDPRLQQRHR